MPELSRTTLAVNATGSTQADTTIDPEIIAGLLEKVASKEALFIERFYEIFFQLRPDALPLFGVHSIAEREEMMQETLRSIYSLAQGDSWLKGNLQALGHSHHEYGVTADMYDSYCDTMLECTREVLGDQFSDVEAAVLRHAVEQVATTMSQGAISRNSLCSSVPSGSRSRSHRLLARRV